MQFIGRGVEHQQDLGALGSRELRRLRLPKILTDEHADAEAAEIHHRGLRARGEPSLLVEHPIVRQTGLAVAQLLTARVVERRGVEEPLAGVLGVPDQDRGAARGIGTRRSEACERGLDLLAESPMEEQVLGWIPREREFGRDQKIGARGMRCLSRSEHAGRIARDIADQKIRLGERETQRVHRVRRPRSAAAGVSAGRAAARSSRRRAPRGTSRCAPPQPPRRGTCRPPCPCRPRSPHRHDPCACPAAR